ncbi:chorismate synthase [Treponema primitia ZAS-2]|uniref:Chorismate synthase n=1 Tax=Treponema primitia (strain ATCC BAA-887 / DSM 12427 / ZAS-2) TaxID=545694 RepID=F5YK45_TREPZ|nr:chorismate synthase [Treponema primitia]AEF86099.1 chorismate synthase [Treponema primitia ZAS-2]
MAGNSFGTIFTVTTFGESHGPALGCIVDGCPAGLPLDIGDIRRELRRRRPGGGGPATTRSEEDEPEILSGVFEGKTLGTPIAIMVRNNNQRSSDYDELRDLYRPGHADWAWEAKYGFRDHRGGGRSSARETLGRVAAGAVAKAFLATQGISIHGWTSFAARIHAPGPDEQGFDLEEVERNPLRFPHREKAEQALEIIEGLRKEGDSAGGTVSCRVLGLKPGLGTPVFGKLDALLASAMLSLGAAKGIEFGAGFRAASMQGSSANDSPIPPASGRSAAASLGSVNNDRFIPHTKGADSISSLPPGVPDLDYAANNAGGILGGISTGMPLDFTVAFKPVPSISKKQQTLDRSGTVRELVIQGRHDVCLCPRAVPVVEAMAALVLADLLLLSRSDRI